MSQDTRSRNQYFSGATVRSYLENYASELQKALIKIDGRELERVFELLEETREKRRTIWTAGNGGSFAIAEHLCCDWTKGLQNDKRPHVKVQSLCSNGPLSTAIANDISYGQVFSEQIKMFGEREDVLVLVSSSGNSENVVQAAEIARGKGMHVISLTGFTGGKLKSMSDINLHVPVSNYGIVEDCHQAVMHILAQFSYLKDRK